MSNIGLNMPPESGLPRGPRRRGKTWIAVILSVGALAAIAFGGKALVGQLPFIGSRSEDFSGAGRDPVVVVTVAKGDTVAAIGRTLKAEGVVASVDAWLAAAKREPATAKIGPGQYQMLSEMSAQDAVLRMVGGEARVIDRLLLREGLNSTQTFEQINKTTGISVVALEAAAKSGDIGLPSWAKNNVEGFLFPATYELEPGESATQILRRLVRRWDRAATKLELETRAKELGMSPHEIMVIASIVQSEGHPGDFDMVSRVIFNRLDPAIWGDTYGYLQMDATINFALGKSEINLTTKQLHETDSPYNTYRHMGLPPGPISSPGVAAMEAALTPKPGDWRYYVTVNPHTGETKFTNNYQEFLVFKRELTAWHAAQK